MSDAKDEKESELLKAMFDEIIKLIREKKIRLESIVNREIDQGSMTRDSFDRIYNLLTDFGRKKGWVK